MLQIIINKKLKFYYIFVRDFIVKSKHYTDNK